MSEAYLHEIVCTALALLPGYELLRPKQVEIRSGSHGNWFVECSMPSMTHEEAAASSVVAGLQARYHLEKA